MNTEREMPPEQILAEFRRWESRQRQRKPVDDAITALWQTQYWPKLGGVTETGRYRTESYEGDEWIEVNRIGAFVTGYQAALHDARMKVKIGPDPQGRGNHKYVNQIVSDWMAQNQTILVTHDADQIAIMRPGVAYFLDIDLDNTDIVGRITLEAVPWAQVIPDVDAGTLANQRFIGRVTCVPVVTARRFFRDQSIKGRPRPSDPLSASFAAPDEAGAMLENSTDRIVRVISMVVFRDCYYDGESDLAAGGKPAYPFEPKEDTTKSIGRLEWYLPDEENNTRPRKVLPIPYRKMDTRPVSPMYPLTYLNIDGFPLLGMSHAERIIDQCRETNLVRSRQATSLRKDVVQYLAPENLFQDPQKDMIKRAIQGAVLEYKPNDLKGKPISDLVTLFPQANMVYQHGAYQSAIDNDILGSNIQAPSQRGQISEGSATEVINAIQTGTSEIEMLRTRKRGVLEQIIRSFICILRQSFSAAGGDTKYKTAVDGQPVTVVLEDLQGEFKVEIEPGESSTQEEQRNLQAYLVFIKAWLGLAEDVAKGDQVAAVALDELVRRAKMPAQFMSEAVLKRVQTVTDKEVPSGPGAESALPGQGSMPPIVGGQETTPGGPQPNPEQPIDNQTGVAQNGVAQG